MYNRFMKKLSEKKRFSLVARLRSANHAWRGIGIVFRTTHNFWGELVLGILVIYLGFMLGISEAELAIIVLSIGFVLVAEIINTSFEVDIDLTSPEYHPYARDAKDIAAGGVLFSIIIACIIGLIIFLPKFIAIL